MGIYDYYDSTENEMFVLVLCQSKMQPNLNHYWDQYRWNNQDMTVKFSSESSDVTLLNYSPETTEGSISNTKSISISGKTDGETAELGFSVSKSTSYTTPEITASAYEEGQTISITHTFKNYDSNLDKGVPCCSLVKRNNLAIFKISNYMANHSYKFNIEHTSTFYRHGKFNCASVSGTYTQQYTI